MPVGGAGGETLCSGRGAGLGVMLKTQSIIISEKTRTPIPIVIIL
jgi:hypothetical protein